MEYPPIRNKHWFRRSFGEGFQIATNEFNFLPEADTDFIFSIYAEQFGFIWCIFNFDNAWLLHCYDYIVNNDWKKINR